MAIYHLHVKVIGRATGASAVASAAYRAAERLRDERIDRAHDFTSKAGVVHSEILLPDGAPEHLSDRQTLWNAVEAGEVRKDAQLAREVEFAIPREMTQEQGIALARDFVEREFVERGMIADLNVHWDIGEDGRARPHAHVMLTMREVNENGFGKKVRDWNARDQVEHWREAWADYANERLATLGIEARIDHRSLEDQGIDLEPQHKIGPATPRRIAQGLEAERLDEHRAIAAANGDRIIAEPTLALDAITHQQATFTTRDLARFVHRHSDGREQFDRVMGAVRGSPELVALGKDGRGQQRFTSRSMLAAERRLERLTEVMAGRERHRVTERSCNRALANAAKRGLVLSGEQRAAFEHITEGRDLGIVLGYAGSGKSALLGVAKDTWEQSGYRVQGLALSGIAAENLQHGSAIPSRTIASIEHGWAGGRDTLTERDILVIDEAGMIGTRQMERVLTEAQKRRAKVVLVGDAEQLQAIEAGAAFRSIAERHPHAEIGTVRRQRADWQKQATRQLATGRTGEALAAYGDHGMVHAADSREQARANLIDRWDRERCAAPEQSRMILTHTNDEVRALNGLARERLREADELGADVRITVERGARDFARGDRIMFLRNERSLGVKNGTLGTLEQVSRGHMAARLDSGAQVAFDLKDYAHVDHGYAATIHKAQGVTVDRTHVLATPGLDRHAAYVALSRHRDSVQLHYGRDDFSDHRQLVRTLSRARPKDMAGDFKRDYTRDYAERRAIRLPGDSPERGTASPERRGMFANFKPVAPKPDRSVPLSGRPGNTLGRAVQRYTRCQQEILDMRERDLPVLPHQRQALDRAGEVLDALRPEASRDLYNALNRDRSLIDETASGNTRRAIRAMQRETQVRTDPALRAERFVKRWQALEQRRTQLYRAGDMGAVHKITGSMGAMAKSLERDAQMESLLRPRARELGLKIEVSMMPGRTLARQLTQYLGLARGRGLGR
ncbi:Ti-type conjugative transfer relaxase TraA [Parasphingopyxis algicola]|uniref:Ti-type conjugative transfer relaxase TraA n=1 Tax=Parasphingopyxis algicola TaxID=2026624 RepID=UPI0015A20DC9|nr:Ti-type conjugative transfer relaxase TraA [Parasphingopyxis algicola]QLC23945.1 Ti-type conjugative transfer relaxase TraA [Parasphingopyxis algicola]